MGFTIWEPEFPLKGKEVNDLFLHPVSHDSYIRVNLERKEKNQLLHNSNLKKVPCYIIPAKFSDTFTLLTLPVLGAKINIPPTKTERTKKRTDLLNEGDQDHGFPVLLFPIQVCFELLWVVVNHRGIFICHQVLKKNGDWHIISNFKAAGKAKSWSLHTSTTEAPKTQHSFVQGIYSSWKKQVHLSEFSSSTFLLPSVPYSHISWQANFWISMLTQDWFFGLSTFLSIILTLRQFVLLYFHWLSTRHCPISYSFYTLYKWLHRHWHNTQGSH